MSRYSDAAVLKIYGSRSTVSYDSTSFDIVVV